MKVLLVATVNKDMSNDLGPLTAKIKLSGEGLHCQIWPFRFVAAIPPQCKPALGNARNKLHILKLQFFVWQLQKFSDYSSTSINMLNFSMRLVLI